MIFQKDESRFTCVEANFTHEEVETLKTLAPGSSKVADYYVFQCEGIKEQVSTYELVRGDLCYNYLTSGTMKVTITQSSQENNETDTNFNQENDWMKLSSYWYTLWLVSCSFNIVFSIIFAVTITAFYYKRYACSNVIQVIKF